MNRKAQGTLTFNIIWLSIVRLIFIIFITISVVMLVKHFLVFNIEVSEIQAQLFINRVIYSPNCFSLHADARPMPGIIDIGLFTDEVLAECAYFGTRNDYLAAELELRYLDGDEEVSVIYNQDGLDVWRPLAGIDGPGGSTKVTDWRYVLVQDGDSLRRAALVIEVLVPNY